jgi:hypothetical protein
MWRRIMSITKNVGRGLLRQTLLGSKIDKQLDKNDERNYLRLQRAVFLTKSPNEIIRGEAMKLLIVVKKRKGDFYELNKKIKDIDRILDRLESEDRRF